MVGVYNINTEIWYTRLLVSDCLNQMTFCHKKKNNTPVCFAGVTFSACETPPCPRYVNVCTETLWRLRKSRQTPSVGVTNHLLTISAFLFVWQIKNPHYLQTISPGFFYETRESTEKWGGRKNITDNVCLLHKLAVKFSTLLIWLDLHQSYYFSTSWQSLSTVTFLSNRNGLGV